MALINCPECGKEISDQAATCPNCGNPISSSATPKTEVKKRNIQKLLAVLLTFISLIGLIATEGRVYWVFLFFAGLFWFIILRIVRD